LGGRFAFVLGFVDVRPARRRQPQQQGVEPDADLLQQFAAARAARCQLDRRRHLQAR